MTTEEGETLWKKLTTRVNRTATSWKISFWQISPAVQGCLN